MSDVTGIGSRLRDGERQDRGLVYTWHERLLLAAMARWLAGVPSGSVRVTLPGGTSRLIGRSGDGPNADIELASYDVLWRSLRRGALGFAESHMLGQWRTKDLGSIFRYFLTNQEALKASDAGRFRVSGGIATTIAIAPTRGMDPSATLPTTTTSGTPSTGPGSIPA